MSSQRGGILIDRFGPGVGIFELLFVPVTTNHFPGGEFQLYLTSHFCPGVGNLTAIFWKMSKSRPNNFGKKIFQLKNYCFTSFIDMR